MTGYNASDTSVGDSGISARTTYTARGWNALTSWDDDKYTYSQMQLYLGTNPISLLEVVSLLNINNISSYMFTYNDQVRPPKYNPIMNLGVINTSAIMWNIDLETGQNKKEIPWPESYQYISGKRKFIDLNPSSFNFLFIPIGFNSLEITLFMSLNSLKSLLFLMT